MIKEHHDLLLYASLKTNADALDSSVLVAASSWDCTCLQLVGGFQKAHCPKRGVQNAQKVVGTFRVGRSLDLSNRSKLVSLWHPSMASHWQILML